jgi:hypothetical protein
MCLQIIVAWNGLAISAFARASTILKKGPGEMEFRFPVEGTEVQSFFLSVPSNFTALRSPLK